MDKNKSRKYKSKKKEDSDIAKIGTDKLEFEKSLLDDGYKIICGIDEVGRGCLFGDVVAAAVIMPLDKIIDCVDDSKKLSEKKRDILYEEIVKNALSYSVSFVDAKTIDAINIYNATKLAMKNAVYALSIKPDALLIDAVKLNLGIASVSVIKGDLKSYLIGCASILAKVTRDRYMKELSKDYPNYSLEKNKGYGSKEHLEALKKYGASDKHRKTFSPVSECIDSKKENEYKRTLF